MSSTVCCFATSAERTEASTSVMRGKHGTSASSFFMDSNLPLRFCGSGGIVLLLLGKQSIDDNQKEETKNPDYNDWCNHTLHKSLRQSHPVGRVTSNFMVLAKMLSFVLDPPSLLRKDIKMCVCMRVCV